MSAKKIEKTALITGAAGGIGTSLVEVLSTAGWALIGTDHPSAIPAVGISKLCKAWIPADLVRLTRDSEQLEAFRDAVLEATDQQGVMSIVHNAAVQCLAPFERLTSASWDLTMKVNVLAPVAITRALLPELRNQHGSIVHIGSIHSQLTKPGFTAYATSKAALAGLTRSMAVELGGDVRVNAIEPAAIATPMLEAGFADTPDLKAQLEAFHPTGGIGIPADVARAALFLLDPANCFLNGCVLPLGGGIHSRLHDPA